MILYIQNVKEFTKKTNKKTVRTKVADLYTISIYKNQFYFYKLAMNNPKMKLRKQFTTASKIK